MLVNPKNKPIDSLLKIQFGQVTEEDFLLSSFLDEEGDPLSFDLYDEWRRTPSTASGKDARRLFDSIVSRLQISKSKRNKDKFIMIRMFMK
ncbi:MAG: hypothetical protein ACOCTU_05895 [Bacteroidota bacterium]